MPTPELREWRLEITRQVNQLRKQTLFLFGLGLLAVVLFGGRLYVTTNQVQTLVNQVREDRYAGCLQRVSEIMQYNARISPPGIVPSFPLPTCPPDPSP
jgi:hypothetical protein